MRERVLAALLLVMCAVAAVVSARLAWAERLLAESTPESVRRSLALAPGNARAWERQAALEPGPAAPSLRRAIALNPYSTAARIDLGLRAEFAGNRQEAEHLLLAAFHQDRMYLTRWTLANFYFRSGDEANFWRWARTAAEFSYASLSPLFDLCQRMSPDAAVVLDRAIPPRAVVLQEYLVYLLSTGRLDAAGQAVTRLAAFRRPEDRPTLLAAVDRSLAAGEVARAVAVWNQVAASGLLPYPALAPERGSSLTNGGFAFPPLGLAFDWRAVWNPEAFVSGHQVEFSGRQLDRTEVLWQPIPVQPQASYTLHYRYSTTGFTAGGLRWHLLDARTRQPLATPSASLSSEDETEQTWRFQVPTSTALARLSLLYQREPGTSRLQGAIELVGVRLSLDRAQRP